MFGRGAVGNHVCVWLASIKLKITKQVRSSLAESENCSTSQKIIYSVWSNIKTAWLETHLILAFIETKGVGLILSGFYICTI